MKRYVIELDEKFRFVIDFDDKQLILSAEKGDKKISFNDQEMQKDEQWEYFKNEGFWLALDDFFVSEKPFD
ncbi:MAG: hypothetical protein ACXACY_27695 [Candidatus Hodarchaeales archaeon]|jgi:hypothetical protein